jgi:group I intron endonuclease
MVVRALNKYGMINFSLVILEYTNSDNVISCEQKWIDLLKPEYNINLVAGNSTGYIHTAESLEKIRQATLGRTHTKEVRQLMSCSRKGVNNAFYGKKHSEETIASLRLAAANRTKLPVQGVEVEITDLVTNLTTSYESIRKAAKAIDSDIKTLSRREKSQLENGINTPYRGRYVIIFKRK